jgi:hypothetical protein
VLVRVDLPPFPATVRREIAEATGHCSGLAEGGAVRDAPYRLVVSGELDARFGYLFNGMELSHVEETTVLVGRVRDDSQLYGFIERFAELGLELLLVQRVVDQDIDVEHEGTEQT